MKVRIIVSRYTHDIFLPRSISTLPTTLLFHKGDIKEILEREIIPCCKTMHEEWNHSIRLNGQDQKRPLVQIISESCHYPEGCFNEYIEIEFCPFCGERIDIVEEL